MTQIVLKKTVSIFLFVFFSLQLSGQKDHLNKRVSFNLSEVSLRTIFTEIEDQGNFTLSYNSLLIAEDSIINFKVKKQKIRKVLALLLSEEKFGFKTIGNHVIIYSITKIPSPPILIKGIITDGRTGDLISNATIFNPDQNLITSSNSQGQYQIEVEGNIKSIGLNFSKQGYEDSIIFFNREAALEKIVLMPIPDKTTDLQPKSIDPKIPDVNEQLFVKWIVPEDQITNSKNLQLFDTREAQISFLPFIGSNGLVSGNVENKLSLNIIAGYSRALNGIEVGGMLNIAKEKVVGTQIAGFGNIVGETTYGSQVSGFFNYNGSDFTGAQITGFSNLVIGDLKGVQAAGFLNSLKGKMYGSQLAGFANYTTESVDGLQAAGFLNFARKDVKAVQVAGFMNYAKNVDGLQIAGFANTANGDVSAAQIAGFSNNAIGTAKFQAAGFYNLVGGNSYAQISGFANLTHGESKGIQVAGFLNYSGLLKGVQIGVFNFNYEADGGIPIGLLSFVGNGKHQIEISSDELFPYNAAFRTGVPAFYNILKIGQNDEYFQFVYGVGTRVFHHNPTSVNLEISFANLISNASPSGSSGFILRLEPMISFKVWQTIKIALSPTMNLALIPTSADDVAQSVYKSNFYEQNTQNGLYSAQAWIGGKVAVQFL